MPKEKRSGSKQEEYKVSGSDILKKIEEIIKAGNARRIIIKNDMGDTVMEFPVTIGVVGIVLAPILAAVGAIAALAANWTVIVEKIK